MWSVHQKINICIHSFIYDFFGMCNVINIFQQMFADCSDTFWLFFSSAGSIQVLLWSGAGILEFWVNWAEAAPLHSFLKPPKHYNSRMFQTGCFPTVWILYFWDVTNELWRHLHSTLPLQRETDVFYLYRLFILVGWCLSLPFPCGMQRQVDVYFLSHLFCFCTSVYELLACTV